MTTRVYTRRDGVVGRHYAESLKRDVTRVAQLLATRGNTRVINRIVDASTFVLRNTSQSSI